MQSQLTIHHLLTLLLLALAVPAVPASDSQSAHNDNITATSITNANSTVDVLVRLVDWKWHELHFYIVVVLFLLAACLLKTIYHHVYFLSAYVPESIVLILLGICIGGVVHVAAKGNKEIIGSYWNLSPELFFFVLLPPIMLEAAFSLCDRGFFSTVGSVLFFAFVGTVINFMIVGFGLYAAASIGAIPDVELSLKPCLLFASFIVAVDPVAVLAIFNDIGVEHSLYYLVFGESLFNDAVTVVLYNTMKAFVSMQNVAVADVAFGVASFFTISAGGIIVGLICGVASCLLTRFTYSTRVVEPLILLTLAYTSYAVGDLFGWSGLLAIIACGLLQAGYAFHNIGENSRITLKYFAKMSASVGEALVFLYLGIEVIRRNHWWSTPFAIWALVLCLIGRFVVTFGAGFAINCYGQRAPIGYTELTVIAIGGLRGAVAFALADLVTGVGALHELFLTTTLFIIMFTCVVIGMSIKPVVSCLRIRLENKPLTSVLHEVVLHCIDHLGAGVEEIAGYRGGNWFRQWLERVEETHVRPLLQREPQTHDEKIVDMYHRVGAKLQLLRSNWKPKQQQQQKRQLDELTPALAKKVSSSTFLRGIDAELEELEATAKKFEATASDDAQCRRRFGEKSSRLKSSTDSIVANDVRRVMQKVRRDSAVAPSNLSRALYSDRDVQQQLLQLKQRTAKGIRILHDAHKKKKLTMKWMDSHSVGNNSNDDDDDDDGEGGDHDDGDESDDDKPTDNDAAASFKLGRISVPTVVVHNANSDSDQEQDGQQSAKPFLA